MDVRWDCQSPVLQSAPRSAGDYRRPPQPAKSPFPMPSPQGTPAALSSPLLRCLSRPAWCHAPPSCGPLGRLPLPAQNAVCFSYPLAAATPAAAGVCHCRVCAYVPPHRKHGKAWLFLPRRRRRTLPLSRCRKRERRDAVGSRLQRFVSQVSALTHEMLWLNSQSIFITLQPTRGLEGWMGIVIKAFARFEAEFSPCNLVQQELRRGI
jgi:hypothetical protein